MPSTSITSLCLCMCRIARKLNPSSVMVLRKEVCSLFILQKLRLAVHWISQQSYGSYIILRYRIVVGLVKSSTKVCRFTFGSVSLHLISKRRGGEWYLEIRGSRKILAGSRNLGSVFDKSRSLVFAWFVFTFFESRNFLPKSLGLGFLTSISASR